MRPYPSQNRCPLAAALAVLGDRWTLLVLRDLLLGVNRYSELLRSLDGIGTTLLAQRLQDLEADGIVQRVVYQEHPLRAEYQLTPKGQGLGPAIRALSDWGYENAPAGSVDEPSTIRASTRARSS